MMELKAQGDPEAVAKAAAELNRQLELAHMQNEQLLEKRRASRARIAALNERDFSHTNPLGSSEAKKEKKKKVFDATIVTSQDGELARFGKELEMISMTSKKNSGAKWKTGRGARNNSKKKKNGRGGASKMQGQQPAAGGSGNRPSLKKRSSFRKHRTEDGQEYFEDEDTGATTWTLPESAGVVEEPGEVTGTNRTFAVAGEDERGQEPAQLGTMTKSKSFRAHKTNDGRVYFHNPADGETTWQLPEGAELLPAEDY